MNGLRDKILNSRTIWKLKDFQDHDLLIKETSISNRLITDPNVYCWYCCHPCGRPPLHLPHRYNDKTNTFHVAGAYCSFSCMAAEIRDTPSIYPRSLYLESMRRQMQGRKMQRTLPAPCKKVLQIFGGWMTIEEFRNITETQDKEGAYTLQIMPPKYVPMREILEKKEQKLNTRVVSRNNAAAKPVDLEKTTSSIANTNFRLRRTCPTETSQTSTVLEKIMGITTTK